MWWNRSVSNWEWHHWLFLKVQHKKESQNFTMQIKIEKYFMKMNIPQITYPVCVAVMATVLMVNVTCSKYPEEAHNGPGHPRQQVDYYHHTTCVLHTWQLDLRIKVKRYKKPRNRMIDCRRKGNVELKLFDDSKFMTQKCINDTSWFRTQVNWWLAIYLMF